MSSEIIEQQEAFDDLCAHIREVGKVAFDTEFVSEFTLHPQLCLMQFATKDRQTSVDPFLVKDLTSWWQIMGDESIEVIIHGGREELKFCHHLGKIVPRNVFDVQLAEGLLGKGYPLSHANLCRRVLGQVIHGEQTRTDWRARPLSARQIEYAVEDVQYLLEIHRRQLKRLEKKKRTDWMTAEMDRMVYEVTRDDSEDRWRKLPGVSRLNRKAMHVARELFRWRMEEAEKLDRPPRRILRDDLLIDLAKRQPKNVKDVTATRGMEQSGIKNYALALLQVMKDAMKAPDDEWPTPEVDDNDFKAEEHVLGKLLGVALANQCAAQEVSLTLVCSHTDLRDFVRWYQNGAEEDRPKLAEGWRAEICGNFMTDLLDGKISLRVADPNSDHPLVFEDYRAHG